MSDAELAEIEGQLSKISSRCPHERLQLNGDGLTVCCDCLAVVGYPEGYRAKAPRLPEPKESQEQKEARPPARRDRGYEEPSPYDDDFDPEKGHGRY